MLYEYSLRLSVLGNALRASDFALRATTGHVDSTRRVQDFGLKKTDSSYQKDRVFIYVTVRLNILASGSQILRLGEECSIYNYLTNQRYMFQGHPYISFLNRSSTSVTSFGRLVYLVGTVPSLKHSKITSFDSGTGSSPVSASIFANTMPSGA